ncbi:MAG: metallopeptidase family protein [Kofleriaceae bacterium]
MVPRASVLIALAAAACGGDRRDPPSPAPTGPAMPAPVQAATTTMHADASAGGPLVGTCGAATAPLPGRDAARDEAAARVDAMLDQANQLLVDGAWADAYTCADMVADRVPRSVDAHHLRGAALAGAGRDHEAALAFDLALAIDPEDPETLRAVADFYVNTIAAKSKDTTALGLELARRGSARAAARRRGQADLRAELALLEAQAHNDLGQADEAAERAAAAVALDPTLTDATHEHGVAQFNLGRFAEARADLEQVLAARPDEPYAHHMLGLALEQLGQGAAAAAHLARAEALAPAEFPPAIAITAGEMQHELEQVIAGLPPAQQLRARQVPITVADLPDPEDLRASDPPFPPTILGLFRGLPLGASPEPGETPPPRAIVLYRLNLARAVRTRAELSEQIARTLLHELGHLDGLDEDDLRRRDLE